MTTTFFNPDKEGWLLKQGDVQYIWLFEHINYPKYIFKELSYVSYTNPKFPLQPALCRANKKHPDF